MSCCRYCDNSNHLLPCKTEQQLGAHLQFIEGELSEMWRIEYGELNWMIWTDLDWFCFKANLCLLQHLSKPTLDSVDLCVDTLAQRQVLPVCGVQEVDDAQVVRQDRADVHKQFLDQGLHLWVLNTPSQYSDEFVVCKEEEPVEQSDQI